MIGVDVSSKGFNNKLKEFEKKYKNINNKDGRSNGGFIDKSVELKFKSAINFWNTYILNNKKNNKNVDNFLRLILEKSKCDIDKCDNRILYVLDMDYRECKNIVDKTKDLNLKYNTYISEFVNIYEFLKNDKYANVFKKAYKIVESNKNEEIVTAKIFVMMWSIMIYSLLYTSAIMNTSLKNKLNEKDLIYDNILDTELIKYVETEQITNKSFISNVFYTGMEICFYLKSIKNLNSDFDKAIKHDIDINSEYNKKVKANESIDIKYSFFNDIKKDNYIVDKTYDKMISTESVLTVILVVFGSIVGIILMITAIRRAIYQISAIEIEIIDTLIAESETLKMNIEMLKKRMNESRNENERDRLRKIIMKQEKSLKEINDYIEMSKLKMSDLYRETDEYIEEDDKRIENENNDETSDDYDVIL